jgi:hypothetical protein
MGEGQSLSHVCASGEYRYLLRYRRWFALKRARCGRSRLGTIVPPPSFGALERLRRGWPEWCVTRTSELAIRIHACGYTSVYLPITFGRGLIPPDLSAAPSANAFRWSTRFPSQELQAPHPAVPSHRWNATTLVAVTDPGTSPPDSWLGTPENIGLQFLVLPVVCGGGRLDGWHRPRCDSGAGALRLSSTVGLVRRLGDVVADATGSCSARRWQGRGFGAPFVADAKGTLNHNRVHVRGEEVSSNARIPGNGPTSFLPSSLGLGSPAADALV